MSINDTVTGPTGTHGMTGANSTNDWDTSTFIKWVSNGCNINDASKVETLYVTFFGKDLHKAGLLKHFVNLRVLYLTYCGLNAIPDEVWELQKLTVLYVNHNYICEMSPKIKNLTNLQRFNCQNNNLIAFPVEICQLTNLTSFNYANNELDILDPAVVDFINKIENVDDPIFTVTRLTRL